MGALGPACGVLVCTTEMANSIVNRCLEGGVDLADEFCMVVVDEVHLAEDYSRGHVVESLLAKLR